jgi:hypothetical protein
MRGQAGPLAGDILSEGEIRPEWQGRVRQFGANRHRVDALHPSNQGTQSNHKVVDWENPSAASRPKPAEVSWFMPAVHEDAGDKKARQNKKQIDPTRQEGLAGELNYLPE